MTRTWHSIFWLVAVSSVALGAGDRWFYDGNSSNLILAHRAWLRGDSGEVVRDVIETLKAPGGDEAVLANSLSLIEATYSPEGTLPVEANWKKLNFFKVLEIHHRRVEQQGKVTFQLEVQGDADQPEMIRQIVLARSGSEVLNKEEKKGEWAASMIPRLDIERGFYLRSAVSQTPFSEGLYRLTLVLKDGRRSDDFVVLSQLTAGASPEVTYPLPNQEITTRNPIVQWLDFRSPQYRDFEQRNSHIYVVRLESLRKEFDERIGPWWGAFMKTSFTSLRVGTRYEHGLGFGEPELRDGRYLLRLAYSETRSFGGLTLVRESVRHIPFSVNLTE